MTFINRRGRIGRRRRFDSLSPRMGMIPYNSPISRFRRRRIQPHSFKSIPRNRLLDGGQRVGKSLTEFGKDVFSAGASGWSFGKYFKRPSLFALLAGIGQATYDGLQYAAKRWPNSPWYVDGWY